MITKQKNWIRNPNFRMDDNGERFSSDRGTNSASHQPLPRFDLQLPVASFSIPDHMQEAVARIMRRLRDAHDTASGSGRDSWEFAIEISQLVDSEVVTHVLQILIAKNWVSYLRETTPAAGAQRTFEPVFGLVLSDRTCFVITKQGFEFAWQTIDQPSIQRSDNSEVKTMSAHHSEPNPQHDVNHNHTGARKPLANSQPSWDRVRRELRVEDMVVKRFKWPAKNQERVLDAFENNGWPRRIENPLLPHPGICPKRRLHDTLKCLNRKQSKELIKFRGDGTGLGVMLEINEDHSS